METKNHIQEWESLFVQHRPFLISFAFRMTGSLSEAEDIVQDTFISCANVSLNEIQNPKSWLTKVCSNKSLDHMKVAHKKRETYQGVWLPDAVPESFQFWGNLQDSEMPDKNLVKAESLSTSFLLMVQKLSPEERVVYLLNEVFDYSFKEIAQFLSKTEDACKKIAQRARKAFENHKRYLPFSSESERVISEFFAIAQLGDAEKLQTLLSDDSEFWADSGGKVPAASKEVIRDNLRTARFFAGIWSSKLYDPEKVRQEFKQVNSRPGLVVSRKGADGNWHFDTIISVEILDGKICRLYAQRNPDKLSNLLSKR